MTADQPPAIYADDPASNLALAIYLYKLGIRPKQLPPPQEPKGPRLQWPLSGQRVPNSGA